MIEFEGLPPDPNAFILTAFVAGFGVVVAAKLFSLVFLRPKTPFRFGEAMSVDRARVVEWSAEGGYVSAGGELWRAASKDALKPGDKVAISAVNGLLLNVKKQSA